MKIVCAAIFIILMTACSMLPFLPEETILLEGQVFNTQVIIDGHQYDGLVIRNCTFENIDANSALMLRNVNDVLITNCTFRSIRGHGIRLWHEGEGTDNVQIIDNIFTDISYNGILGQEPNINTVIRGNDISNIGLDWFSGPILGAPHHGIYWQGPGFLIENNRIYNNYDNTGNALSVRTWGIIRGNILYDGAKRGITYYADHPGNGGTLLIENNVVFDNRINALGLDSAGSPENLIGNAIIRFNTLVQTGTDTLRVHSSMAGVNVQIYGNILVNQQSDGEFVRSDIEISQYQNLEQRDGTGFVDFTGRNLDLVPGSPAEGFAEGISDYPATDIDGDIRPTGMLDAGADEI